jgi:bis(5'-nucleosyl)-tetraphosphatase (symmetrical)
LATYAIGDVQGCAAELSALLDRIAFDPVHDRLWFAGDLINRGGESLAVLRLVKALGPAAQTVLGNHDLHFLAIHFGGHQAKSADTFDALLAAPDVDDLAHWLRRQPLLLRDDKLGFVLTHAGVPHIWNLDESARLADEVSAVLGGDQYAAYCRALYGNEPKRWREDLQDMARWRLITNYFTRMRMVMEDGTLDFRYKGDPADAPEPWRPWFEWPRTRSYPHRILFGHWAALQGATGVADCIALDTGCVWGRELTAFCLEDGRTISVRCAQTN